jgi:ribosome biogenesis GTPase / thiamine phosphate phosphatase
LNTAKKQNGLVVASFGRHFLVETESGERVTCHPRGKKSQAVVGDRVQWLASADEGTIEKIDERRNLFYRQDELRTKAFAANLDHILIVIAAEPVFSEMQLARALVAAEAAQIEPVILLNKSDLTDAFATASARLQPYRRMSYRVVEASVKQWKNGLWPSPNMREQLSFLEQSTTLILGPSGAGKSSLVNLLVPGASAQTGEISQALNSGKHTTTNTQWYWLDAQPASTALQHDEKRTQRAALIDSPGFQEFGLHHLQATDLTRLMPDIREHAGECKFYNCTHLHEPGCDVKLAADRQEISASRYKIYSDLFTELSQTRY